MKKIAKKEKVKGFTLIELLIVIAIIGILASIVFVSLSASRSKARDSKKKYELAQILKLVESYYRSENSAPANVVPGNWSVIGQNGCLQELITKNYTNSFPASPDSNPYYYYDYGAYVMVSSYMSSNQSYGPDGRGWHCSDAAGGVSGSKYWCAAFNK